MQAARPRLRNQIESGGEFLGMYGLVRVSESKRSMTIIYNEFSHVGGIRILLNGVFDEALGELRRIH
jgi:hypothetical protein